MITITFGSWLIPAFVTLLWVVIAGSLVINDDAYGIGRLFAAVYSIAPLIAWLIWALLR